MPARYGAAIDVIDPMIILDDRADIARRRYTARRQIETERALKNTPSVILPSRAPRCLEIHLFPPVLSDISDIKVARSPVEREAPRISYSQRPDFWQKTRSDEERVRCGNAVIPGN